MVAEQRFVEAGTQHAHPADRPSWAILCAGSSHKHFLFYPTCSQRAAADGWSFGGSIKAVSVPFCWC